MQGAASALHFPLSTGRDAGNAGRKTWDGMLRPLCAMRDAQTIFHLADDAMRGAQDALQRTRCVLQCAGNAVRKTRDTLQ